jgi:outer membrane receptor protein involved in Fe transport
MEEITMKQIFQGLCTAILVVSFLLCGIGSASAQSSVGGVISGTLTDSSGAALPGGSIEILSMGTGRVERTKTDESGFFRSSTLVPGQYKVGISAAGFSSYVVTATVEVGRVTSLSPVLKLGDTKETVNVSAEAPAINTDSSDFSANVNQTSINNLPINGRHWTSFALLTPGVSLGNAFGLVTIRGISSLQNNFTVDGSDDNQAFQSTERGFTRVGSSTSQAAIQEFQVFTSNYSAQYGRAAGGGVNAVTKSGTNEFHGSAFWYYRDNEFGATNPYTIVNNHPVKPKDKRHQYGGTLGGPLVKDKLFFFYTFDQQKRSFPIVLVPSPAFIASEAAAGTAAQSRGVTSAQAASAINYITKLSGTLPRLGNQILNFFKTDYQINPANRLTLSYNRMRWDSPGGFQTNPVFNRAVTSDGDDFVKVDSAIGSLNTVISPHLNNVIRYEYARDGEFDFAQKPSSIEPTTAYGLAPETFININGGFSLGAPQFFTRSNYPDERENQIIDVLTWSKDNHTITTGVDYRRVHDKISSLQFYYGSYQYAGTNALANFITDYAHAFLGSAAWCTSTLDLTPGTQPCYSQYTQGFGTQTFEYNTNEYSAFLQDDWKFSPKLTFNMALRYDFEKLPSTQIPNASFALTNQFPSDKNNLGPRVGFAYQPFTGGRMVLRGGYGLYFGRIQNGTIFSALTSTAAPAAQFNYTLSASATSLRYPYILTSGTAPAVSNIKYFAPGFQAPMVQQADLIIQQEIGWNTVLTGSYLLSLGRQLPNFVDTNLAAATTTKTYNFVGGPLDGRTWTLPFYTTRQNAGTFNQTTAIVSNVNSNYNALSLQFDHRMSQGLQFQLSYVWSKALDYGMNQTQSADANDQFDPTSVRPDYGKSLTNLPQRFVGSIVYSPTFSLDSHVARVFANGWTLSPTLTVQSGLPYSYVVSGGATGQVSGATATLNGSGGANYVQILGRNSLNQPDIINLDLRLSRAFQVLEKYHLVAILESFNLPNRQNITAVNTTAYANSGTTLTYQPSFKAPTAAGNTVYRERQIQASLQFNF